VRRFMEAQANADLHTLEELLAPDFVDHSLQPDHDPGREGYIRSVAEEPAIFSKVRAKIEDQAAEGDKVISRLTISRIHDRGEFLGLASTRMEIRTSAIVLHRIEGARSSRSGARVRVSAGTAPAPGAREDRARAHRAGAAGGKAHPAGLAAQGGAPTRGLADLSLLAAGQGGRRRLLRVLRARRRSGGLRCGRRNG
jgi:predicted ester cyclase